MVSLCASKCHFSLDTSRFTTLRFWRNRRTHMQTSHYKWPRVFLTSSSSSSLSPMARVGGKLGIGVREAGAEGGIHQINHESVVEIVRYKECMHNHAASMGHYSLDGCGEFFKSGEDGTPEALICGACECHRSFHRKEVLFHDDTTQVWYLHRPVKIAAAPVPLPRNVMLYNLRPPPANDSFSREGEIKVEVERRKKPRTNLTKEQKARMSAFAESLGWKSQRHHEEDILRFCSEIGISRRVFKIWLNNNKHGKEAPLPPLSLSSTPPPPRPPPQPSSPPAPSAEAST